MGTVLLDREGTKENSVDFIIPEFKPDQEAFCPICRDWFPTSFFYGDVKQSAGREYKCKECSNKRREKRRETP